MDTSPGIRILTRKNGEVRYEARVHRRGVKTQSKTFKTLEKAQEWKGRIDQLISFEVTDPHQLDPVEAPAPISSKGMTVAKIIDAYLKSRAESTKPLASNQITDYNRVKTDLGGLQADALRNEDLVNYVKLLLKTPRTQDQRRIKNNTLTGEPRAYAEATIRKFITALRNALTWKAQNSDLRLTEFLFAFPHGLAPQAWKEGRERRLKTGEEDKLYAAGLSQQSRTYTPEDWRAVIGFALETAMREQEIAKARWQDITQDGFRLTIPKRHSKTKKQRTVLLSKRAREIIKAQRKSCSENNPRIFHQFPNAKAICASFARLRKRANVEALTFHDLRHEATSRLCEGGKLSIMETMEMTGHTSMTTFKRYVHLIPHGNRRLD